MSTLLSRLSYNRPQEEKSEIQVILEGLTIAMEILDKRDIKIKTLHQYSIDGYYANYTVFYNTLESFIDIVINKPIGGIGQMNIPLVVEPYTLDQWLYNDRDIRTPVYEILYDLKVMYLDIYHHTTPNNQQYIYRKIQRFNKQTLELLRVLKRLYRDKGLIDR